MKPIAAALIQAGGKGTRMARTHPSRRKTMLLVKGRSLLEWNLANVFRSVAGLVWIALGEGQDEVDRALRRSTLYDPERIRILVEHQPLGTAGSLAQAASKDGTTLLTNGDLVTAMSFDRLLDAHRRAKAQFTIAVHEERHRLELGEVLADDAGVVRAYAEKPEKSWTISSGVYLIEPEVAALIRSGEALGIPELVRRAIERGLHVHAHRHGDPWIDVNDASALEAATRLVESEAAAFGDLGGPLPRKTVFAGIDLGATKTLALLVDHEQKVVGRSIAPSLRGEGGPSVVARALDLLDGLLASTESRNLLSGIGIGFAGLVDPTRSNVLSSIMVPGLDQFPMAKAFSDRFEVPSLIENDATAAGFGEFVALGSPPGQNLVLLTVGTGIGGAIVLDGRIYRGATGTSGEFGNMSLDWKGERCWCGSPGCLNMLASGSAILQKARRLGVAESDAATAAGVLARAKKGDRHAEQALEESAQCLGAGIANIINILNPDRISLMGGVIELGPEYLDQVRASARERALKEPFSHAVIAPARLGYDTGAFGAAMLACADASAGFFAEAPVERRL